MSAHTHTTLVLPHAWFFRTLDTSVLADFRGNYTDCGGTGSYLGDQDVVTTIAAMPNSPLGTFSAWPLCFNYRGWSTQRGCMRGRRRILVHMPSSKWPPGAKESLVLRAKRGECRAVGRAPMRPRLGLANVRRTHTSSTTGGSTTGGNGGAGKILRCEV